MESLPIHTLVNILQHIDIRQRLGSCALVSTAMNLAAGKATTTVITTPLKSSACTIRLINWLSTDHGTHITRLDLQGMEDEPMLIYKLPCIQLQQLRLQHCELMVNVDGYNTINDLTSLTHLSMDGCLVNGEQPSPMLPNLKFLSMQGITTPKRVSAQVGGTVKFLDGFSHNLSSLTHLCLSLQPFPDSPDADLGRRSKVPIMFPWAWSCSFREINPDTGDSVQRYQEKFIPKISCLVQLRDLKVATPFIFMAQEWLPKTQYLTSLLLDGPCFIHNFPPGLQDGAHYGPLHVHALEYITRLTALKRLQLRTIANLDVDMLGRMTQLQYLELMNTPVHAAFLPLIPKLQELTYLYWVDVGGSHVTATLCEESFAALTANSKLQELHLHPELKEKPKHRHGGWYRGQSCHFDDLEGLHHVGQMFPCSGTNSSPLRVLSIAGQEFNAWRLLKRVFSCQPDLRALDIECRGTDLSPLRAATQLTALTINLSVWEDINSSALTELSSLKELSVKVDCSSSEVINARALARQLQGLTCLTGLERLSLTVEGHTHVLSNQVRVMLLFRLREYICLQVDCVCSAKQPCALPLASRQPSMSKLQLSQPTHCVADTARPTDSCIPCSLLQVHGVHLCHMCCSAVSSLL